VDHVTPMADAFSGSLTRRTCGARCASTPLRVVNKFVNATGVPPVVIGGQVRYFGGDGVVAVGFCWRTTPLPLATVEDNVEPGPSPPPQRGEAFAVTFYGGSGAVAYGRLFARNARGELAYAPQVSFVQPLCLAEGTAVSVVDPVTRAVATKAIQDITYADEVLGWDFDAGRAVAHRPLWIMAPQVVDAHTAVHFDDGRTLRVVGGHRVFNVGAGAFTPAADTDMTPLGTATLALDCDKHHGPAVVRTERVHGAVRSYNVVTGGGLMSLFAEGLLTSCRFNNLTAPCGSARRTSAADAMDAEFPVGVVPPVYYQGLQLARWTPHVGVGSVQATAAYVARMEATKARLVLFLDHQGVMRTRTNPQPGTLADFDAAAVAALNAVLDASPGVDIVVTSDWAEWRGVDLAALQALYAAQGVRRPPVGITPRLPGSKLRAAAAGRRVEEIRAWLRAAPSGSVLAWVAVDDLPLPLPEAHFVLSGARGLAASGMADAVLRSLGLCATDGPAACQP
jgi:hypothetical protein